MLMRQAILEGIFKSAKTYSPSHRESKNLCFFSKARRVKLSHTFVYNAVGVNPSLLAKPPSRNWLKGY